MGLYYDRYIHGKEISLIVIPDVYSVSMSRLFVRLIALAMKGYIQRGSNISRGVQLFPGGGVQLLIPYRNPITCVFSGGSGPPVPALWIRTCPPKPLRSLISVFDKLSLEITITYTFNIEISRF